MRNSKIKTLFAKADEQVHVDEIRKQKTYHAMIDEMEKQRTPMMSIKNILLHQIWYMDKVFFIIYGVIICLGIVSIAALQYIGVNQNEIIIACMVGAGILSVVSISIIDKVFFGRMAELGECCYFNTKQCVAAWLAVAICDWLFKLLPESWLITDWFIYSDSISDVKYSCIRNFINRKKGKKFTFVLDEFSFSVNMLYSDWFDSENTFGNCSLDMGNSLFSIRIYICNTGKEITESNRKRRNIMHELRLLDIQKKYKDKEAVRKFNYTFTNGVYGLLGENGAGKTTLMRLICGVLQPTGGSIYCDNIEIVSMGAEYRKLLGYLPQDFGYYGDFTAERFLRYMAALKALPEDYANSRIDELLDMVELKNVKKKKLKTYSGGMIRRIGIAQALLNNPEILILDEPTAGLDPKERVRFRNVISSLGKNRMVLLSTHIVSDIDYIADCILIMKNGELIQEGTEKEITDKVEGCVWKCIVSEKEAGQITSSFIVSNMRSRGESVELRIVSKRQPVVGAENIESTLEDAYLYHTQITGEEKNATL